jgi:hypothetical protein
MRETLSEATVQKQKTLFEEDEFSRMCPGKKQYVSIKTAD